jgi:hypothetical protein
MVVKTNKDRLMRQVVMGKVSAPTLAISGRGSYVTTWDGKPKLGIGIGGIKLNVKVGDPCLGWPQTEYMEPGVALMGVDDSTSAGRSAPGSVMAFVKYSCIGNTVEVMSGAAKGAKGYITGKGGMSGTSRHVQAHFDQETKEKLLIGDKIKVNSNGVAFEVEGFDGRVFNMEPSFFEAMNPDMDGNSLVLPVAKVIPIIAMGYGVGGSSAESGTWCIQSNPPHLVEKIGISDLRFGDIVALQDGLISYGKGYYKGAVTVGVITTGESQQAGQGPGVMAIASSKHGKIKTRIDPTANVAKYLGVEA